MTRFNSYTVSVGSLTRGVKLSPFPLMQQGHIIFSLKGDCKRSSFVYRKAYRMKYNLALLEKLWQKYAYKQGERYLSNRQQIIEDYYKETGIKIPVGSFNHYTRQMDLKHLYETRATTFNERTDAFIDEKHKPFTEHELLLALGFSPEEFELRHDKKVGTVNHWWLDRGSLEERIRNGQLKIDVWRKKYNINAKVIKELIESIDIVKPIIDIDKDTEVKDNGMLLCAYKDLHFPVNTAKDYAIHQKKTIKEIDRGWEEINFIIGSDMFQANDSKGRTINDTVVHHDVKIQEYFKEALTFYKPLLDKAIEKADTVNILYEEGNHDKDLSIAFVVSLKWVYGDKINFTIDEHNPYQFIRYKNSFIGTHHGDKKIRPKAVGETFYRYYAEEIGKAKYAEVLIGHIHHLWSEEYINLLIQGLSTAAKDTQYEYNIGKAKGKKALILREYDDHGLVGTKLIR